MDPNPKKFPLLSFVLARINSIGKPHPKTDQSATDLEQPTSDEVELISRMPHLNHPELFDSMAGAVTDVAQTRSILNTLGSRPDHESIDVARSRIAELEASSGKEYALSGSEGKSKEMEMQGLRALVQLDDMHEAYERLLREAEERLVGIYGDQNNAGMGEESDGIGLNQEVVGVLRDAKEGKCVQEVDLSRHNLIILPEEFGRVSTLRLLNLSNNQLQMIPDSIAGLEHLEELRLATNLLLSLPDSIGLLTNLKILDVSGNKLTRLPDSISHCRSLVELDASYNDLTYLPTNIGLKLANLQTLMIHLNKLRYLPTSVCEMRSLRHLDAHFNALHGLPHYFGKLTNLEILNLSSNFNDMTELPQSFGDLINLTQLDLSNNQIRILPDSFGFLRNLVKLNLEQNPLVIPPADVVNNGPNAVVEFMDNRMVEMIEQEERDRLEGGEEDDDGESSANAGWLTRSTSLVTTLVYGVSDYLGTGQRPQPPPRDPYLEEQR